MNEDGPIWGHIAFWAAGVILAGIVLIGAGLGGSHGLSTHIVATGSRIELTWDNGATATVREDLDVDDPHLVSVRAWGGSCWITVNDAVVAFKERSDPLGCTWSREQT